MKSFPLSLDPTAYHEQVVEKEDFSLMDAAPLGPVRIGNLEQLTAAHQPAVGQRQNLRHRRTWFYPPTVSSSFLFTQANRGLDVLRVSCRPPSSPPPGPVTRGRRWSSAPTSGSVRRWPPAGLWGYPDHYPHLWDTHPLELRQKGKL